jgi:hypothetical protein
LDCGKLLKPGDFAWGFWQVTRGVTRGWLGSRHGPSPLSETGKGRPKAAFFFFYSISSEYQIERINRPNIIEGIRVEAVWNEGSLLW